MKETKLLSNPPFSSDCEVKEGGLLLSNGEGPTLVSELQMNLLQTKHVALKDGKRKTMDEPPGEAYIPKANTKSKDSSKGSPLADS